MPTPLTLLFQPASGIHNSNAMLESAVGRMLPATRQKSGRPVSVLLLPGGVKLPPVTCCAIVITASGGSGPARLAQGVAASAEVATSAVVPSSPAAEANFTIRFIGCVSSDVLPCAVAAPAPRTLPASQSTQSDFYMRTTIPIVGACQLPISGRGCGEVAGCFALSPDEVLTHRRCGLAPVMHGGRLVDSRLVT